MTTCPICLNFLDKNLVVGRCGHVYHEQCINQWIEVKKICPHCNGKLKKKSLVKLYCAPCDIAGDILGDPSKFDELPPEIQKKVEATRGMRFGNQAKYENVGTTAAPSGPTQFQLTQLRNEVKAKLKMMQAEKDRRLEIAQELDKLRKNHTGYLIKYAELEKQSEEIKVENESLQTETWRLRRDNNSLKNENDQLGCYKEALNNTQQNTQEYNEHLTGVLCDKDYSSQVDILRPMVLSLRQEVDRLKREAIQAEKQKEEEAQGVQDGILNLKFKLENMKKQLSKMESRLAKAESRRDIWKKKARKLADENKRISSVSPSAPNQPGATPGGGLSPITPGGAGLSFAPQNPVESRMNRSFNQSFEAQDPALKEARKKKSLMTSNAIFSSLDQATQREEAENNKRKPSAFGFNTGKPVVSSSSSSTRHGFTGRGGSGKFHSFKKRRIGNNLGGGAGKKSKLNHWFRR